MKKERNEVVENGESSTDLALLTKVAAIESEMLSTCDLVPLSHWGFDDTVQAKIKQRKHSLVNQLLTDKEKKKCTKAQKQLFAKTIGSNFGTVSEVFEWLKTNGPSKTKKPVIPQPVEAAAAATAPAVKDKKRKMILKKPPIQKTIVIGDDTDEEEIEEIESAKGTMEEGSSSSEESEEENEVEDDDEDDDDDEDKEEDNEVVVRIPGAKPNKIVIEKKQKSRSTNSSSEPPVKKTKLDYELEAVADVDTTQLDPVEARRIAMLKLQKKIENLKVSRRATKEKDRLQHKEDERKMARRMSKLKMKQRRADEKKREGQQPTPAVAKENGKASEPNPKTEVAAEEKPSKASLKSESVLGEDGKMVYSKFDFIVKDRKKRKLSKAENREKFTGKDYKALMRKVEKREIDLAKLREKEPEKAKEMEQEIKWNRALKKAEGIKVKDNVELLKKGLKTKEKLKEKRLEKWEQRTTKLEHDKEKRQEKRKTNMQRRVDGKKQRKLAQMRKKGRIL